VKNFPFHSLLTLGLTTALALVLCSCGASDSKPSSSSSSSASARQTLSQRLDTSKPQPGSYKQDSEGKWQAQTGKRSSFEGKTDPNFASKSFEKKAYKTGDYSKKSWWGNKDYASKTYKPTTEASRFQKSARQQGQQAQETSSGQSFAKNYQTDDYATSSAREANASAIEKGSNDLIENRRKLFKQPEVTDWQQRRDLSVDQTKGILGN
jgi:hypothetical protein